MAIINGTAAAETLTGTAGSDTINGVGGNDTITGGLGNDLLKGGAGNDLFLWGDGDGNDTVSGGLGFDTLRFTTGVFAETMALTANSGHVRLTSTLGPTTMDLDDVERVQINALAGADGVSVGNLAGTDVKQVAINLGGADGAQDTVVVNAGNASNAITLSKLGSVVSVNGLSAKTTIAGFEALDYLRIYGESGNDSISASALPFATMLLTLDGGAGNDKITGSKGEDTIWGGTGNDTVAGGGGYDAVNLGAGNDLYLWAVGDGGDAVEGDAGIDTLRFSGNNSAEAISLYAAGIYAHLIRGAEDTATTSVERLVVNAAGGADTIFVYDLTGSDVKQVDINLAADGKVDTAIFASGVTADYLTVGSVGGKVVTNGFGATVTLSTDKADLVIIEGGDGNDIIEANGLAAGIVRLQIRGGNGDDTILGSAGNDTVIGGLGNDLAFLGEGNDRYLWSSGDNNDTIDGQTGFDTLQLDGSSAGESLVIDAVGGRARFRDGVGVVLANSVERIELNPLAGFDQIVVYDLAGTAVKQVVVDIGGDLQFNGISRLATSGDDVVTVTPTGSNVSVTGLSAQLTVVGGVSTDVLFVNGMDGNDRISASSMPAGAIGIGLSGDNGNDTLSGGAGNDIMYGGAGNDLFLWNPGQGNDIIEGEANFDTVRMTGSAGDEIFGIAANGARVALTRNLGAVFLDIDDVERLQVRALGGADTINIGSLAGTDVTLVDIDLAAVAGGTKADGKVDTVAVTGTGLGDAIGVGNIGGTVVVTGLQAMVNVTHADKTDRLIVDGGALGDTINATGLAAGMIALQLSGGLGDDILIASAGNDTVIGGDGDDTALLGKGNDLFVWNLGDDNDIIEGQTGIDTLRFNGSDTASEAFQITANGSRVRLDRSVGPVVMDLNDVERIQLNAFGGADTIYITDVSGTDLKQVAIDLGASDAAADTVFLFGRATNDTVTVAMAGSAVQVTGLPAAVSVTHAESANDLLRIYADTGNDSINASTLPGGVTKLWLAGAEGNDTLTGSAGHDRLDGDEDNDILSGGGGKDTIYGGTGNDTINGGAGNDTIEGNEGNDRIDVSLGNDIVRYSSVLDGKDVIIGFDGNPLGGGQDVLDLNALFDSLNVLTADRVDRVFIDDKGATVNIAVDADGNAGNGFELLVATLHTTDIITKGITGEDVIVGTG